MKTMTAEQIGKALNVSKFTVLYWAKKHPQFPSPCKLPKRPKTWLADEVLEFARSN